MSDLPAPAARSAATPSRAAGRAQRSSAGGAHLLLAGGGFALLIGIWTGLARAGVHDPITSMDAHGIIMVLGFLGTLIALERAVAYGATWAYAAPLLTTVAVVWLLAGLPAAGAGALLTAAGAGVVAVYARLLARRVDAWLALMCAGAVAWVVAAGLWTVGWDAVRVSPALAAFLVLTIVGERLELSRLRVRSIASQRGLLAAAVVFACGVATALIARRVGLVVAGIGLLLQAAWLGRNDIARVTVHHRGLPRFAAVCLLAGYVWLALGGALWIAEALERGGWLVHDAALHAVFLGFVLSMVMGHAPIILPGVLRIPLPYHPSAWVPLVLLHTSVALRIGADVAGSVAWRGWAAHANATALLVFLVFAGAVVFRARHQPRSS